jgi:hypothetical protein
MDVDLVSRAAYDVAAGAAAGLIGAVTGHAGRVRPGAPRGGQGVTRHGRQDPHPWHASD